MRRALVVERLKQRADGSVHLCETEELALAQPCQGPVINQQNQPVDADVTVAVRRSSSCSSAGISGLASFGGAMIPNAMSRRDVFSGPITSERGQKSRGQRLASLNKFQGRISCPEIAVGLIEKGRHTLFGSDRDLRVRRRHDVFRGSPGYRHNG
jgi:hypothetical protein